MEEYKIRYSDDVTKKDIPKLSSVDKIRIKRAIETKLATAPLTYSLPLRGQLYGLQKLRMGDFRIIFFVRGKEVVITIIAHRSVVYKDANKRMK